MDAKTPVMPSLETSPAMAEHTISAAAATQGAEALKDIAYGSVAGIAGKFVEYPFDTVKVRLQSQPDHLPLRYAGPLDCFRQSIQQDGFRGLYRGISAPLFGAAAETSSLFFSYRVAKELLCATVLPSNTGDDLPLGALVAAGGMSGAFTSLILTPIELVKCRMQVPLQPSIDPTLGSYTRSTSVLPGPLGVIAAVYRSGGVLGFWRGQLGTLIREMGGSAAWFGTYETLSLAFRKRIEERGGTDGGIPVYQQMAAGAAAGMNYNFLFYPADTIKSKMQTEEFSMAGRRTFMSVGKALWQSHGLKGLYRGCGITVARAAPSSALIFAIYEGLRKTF